MSAFVDTNVLVRHLVGEPTDMAEAATRFLTDASGIALTGVVVAETIYVLESVYRMPRDHVAGTIRSLLSLPSLTVEDAAVLARSIEVYELDRIHFAEAYLVARAEHAGSREVVSFDRAIDRVGTVRRIEP